VRAADALARAVAGNGATLFAQRMRRIGITDKAAPLGIFFKGSF
jgi:hypothetical protein